jgi:hypothetical protein
VTRPRGGRKIKNFGEKKQKTIGAKNKKNTMRKDRITYVDKSTTRVYWG